MPVSAGVLNAAMLLGLLGAALPVLIHLLNRRRDPVIDWGAMQFLDLGRRARRRIRLTEILLMLARMALLVLVALAMARPFLMPAAASPATTRAGGGLGAGAPARDVVLVFDGSDSMERRCGGTTPRALAVRWARRFVAQLRAGDSVAVLVAGERIHRVLDPPSFDKAAIDAALAALPAARGASDLPAAMAEAFHVLERTGNPGRDVIVLTDGQRSAWRPGEARRWALVRDLQRRLAVPPRVWALALGAGVPSDGPNGTVEPLVVARSLVTPGLAIGLSTTLANSGPGFMTRTAELLADGRPVPGAAQAVGPIPAGGRTPISFRTTLQSPGTHTLAVRLAGDDSLPGDDEAAASVTVTPAVPVLLVNGRPGLEPLSGATDFLRAALAPSGDDTPQVNATVIRPPAFGAESLNGQRVVVLAGLDRIAPGPAAALGRFLEAGGGLLIAPGEQTEASSFNGPGWMPAAIGPLQGDLAARRPVAHPAPATFQGPVLAPFGTGNSPPLAEADLFAYHLLRPTAGALVAARLDNGAPWVVERSQGRGRVILLAAGLDAASGTLPVNPDFVPLAHEWIFHLASAPVSETTASREHALRRERESDLAPLAPAEAARLAEGWPLVFESDPARLDSRLLAAERGGRRELWRGLVLAALAGLCVEVYLTRRLVRSQGLDAMSSAQSPEDSP